MHSFQHHLLIYHGFRNDSLVHWDCHSRDYTATMWLKELSQLRRSLLRKGTTKNVNDLNYFWCSFIFCYCLIAAWSNEGVQLASSNVKGRLWQLILHSSSRTHLLPREDLAPSPAKVHCPPCQHSLAAAPKNHRIPLSSSTDRCSLSWHSQKAARTSPKDSPE